MDKWNKKNNMKEEDAIYEIYRYIRNKKKITLIMILL